MGRLYIQPEASTYVFSLDLPSDSTPAISSLGEANEEVGTSIKTTAKDDIKTEDHF